jgi:hypothetical protein
MITYTDDEVREQVEAELGPVPDEVWAYLEGMEDVERYVDYAFDECGDINLLLKKARAAMALAGIKTAKQGERLKTERPDSPDELTSLRRIAVSLLLARQAEQDDLVKAFRLEVLGNKLLEPSEIMDWVITQVDKDGPVKTHWITIPVVVSPQGPIKTRWRSGNITQWEPDPNYPTPEYKAEWEPLRANVPSDDADPDDPYDMTPTLWTPINRNGGLGRLRDVAEHLINPRDPSKSPRYPWSKEEATTFILTNLPPIVNAVDVRLQDSPSLPGATRIVLTVDPSVSPAELAEQYKKAREQVLPRRYRSLTAQKLRLAAFVSQRPESETWEQTRRAWNKWGKEQGWSDIHLYSNAVNFSRAARDAVNHLLRLQAVSSQ